MRKRWFIAKRCGHGSHRWGLWCWRPSIWDGYCAKHNNTCLDGHGGS